MNKPACSELIFIFLALVTSECEYHGCWLRIFEDGLIVITAAKCQEYN